MKKPLFISIASVLIVAKAAEILYTVYFGETPERYSQTNTTILAGVYVAAAVWLHLKPRILRWPVGTAFALSALRLLGCLSTPGIAPRSIAIFLVGSAICCWIAYSLLLSNRMRTYLEVQNMPNKPPTADASRG